MNIVNYINRCSITGGGSLRDINAEFKIMQYSCCNEYEVDEEEAEIGYNPLLSMDRNTSGVLATGTEHGSVVFNRCKDLALINKIKIHRINPVFDLKWRPHEDRHILTAAGDCTLCLYDVDHDEQIISFKAHESSIRTISFLNSNVFASGGRDGCLKIWDIRDVLSQVTAENRTDLSRYMPKEKGKITYAHCRDPKNHGKGKKIQECGCNRVTAVIAEGHYIYSGGTNDGLIKIWDSRRMAKERPVSIIGYPKKNSFSSLHGFSSFAISNGVLYASCSDANIYGYSLSQSKFVHTFKGHRFCNYSKIAVNDEYLIIGSSEEKATTSYFDLQSRSLDQQHDTPDQYHACVWSLKSNTDADGWARWPICKLPEVMEVNVASIESTTSDIFTGCDFGRIRQWSIIKDTYHEKMGYIKNLVRYKVNPNRMEKDGMIQVTKSSPPGKQKRSKSLTPSTAKRKKAAPLTPITNFFTKVPRQSPKIKSENDDELNPILKHSPKKRQSVEN